MERKDIYQPISRDTLVELLKRARNNVDQLKGGNGTESMRDELSRIQVRIEEAIPGITNPYQINGDIAKKQHEVGRAYVRLVDAEKIGSLQRAAEEIADEILAIISRTNK